MTKAIKYDVGYKDKHTATVANVHWSAFRVIKNVKRVNGEW